MEYMLYWKKENFAGHNNVLMKIVYLKAKANCCFILFCLVHYIYGLNIFYNIVFIYNKEMCVFVAIKLTLSLLIIS